MVESQTEQKKKTDLFKRFVIDTYLSHWHDERTGGHHVGGRLLRLWWHSRLLRGRLLLPHRNHGPNGPIQTERGQLLGLGLGRTGDCRLGVLWLLGGRNRLLSEVQMSRRMVGHEAT